MPDAALPEPETQLPEPAGHAPGAPGTSPSWTSSAKDMVGCGLGPARLWFTLGFGIVNAMWLEAEVFSSGDKRSDTSSQGSGGKVS